MTRISGRRDGWLLFLTIASAIMFGLGLTVIVRAEDDHLRALITQAARPFRAAAPIRSVWPADRHMPARPLAARVPPVEGSAKVRTALSVATLSGPTVDPNARPPRRVARSVASVAGAFCVRLCDGYFFPAGPSAANGGKALESLCQAQCPEAKTAVFTASRGSEGIAQAVAADGRSYGALANAFRYRRGLSTACQCRAVSEPVNFASIATDPTARRNDIVFTPIGFRVFAADGKAAPLRALRHKSLTRPERILVARSEATSLRGRLTQATPDAVKLRIGREIRLAEGKAEGFLPIVVRPLAPFEGPVRVVVARSQGFSQPERRITMVR